MYQPQQRKKLDGVQSNSAYFTSSNNNTSPPPPPPGSYYSNTSPPGGGYYGGSGYNSSDNASQSSAPSPQVPKRTYAPETTSYSVASNTTNPYSGGSVKKKSGGFSMGCILMTIVFWTALVGVGGYFYVDTVFLPSVLEEAKREQEMALEEKEQEKEALLIKIRQVERESKSEREKKDSQINSLVIKGEKAEQSIHRSQQALTELQQSLQRASLQQLVEKYGHGPYKVEFEMHFPNDDRRYFLVELAPAESMPYTIWTFLQQVESQLYINGNVAFHHNAPHVAMAGPVENHLNPEGTGKVIWEHSGWGELVLHEYSNDFPHQQYTLGFTRQAGQFYINTLDNTQAHGPGGFNGEGDACFGRIIQGQDVVDRIHENHEGEWEEVLGGNVAIRSVHLIHNN